jgi:RNAse (barnase) inhibitor barstar
MATKSTFARLPGVTTRFQAKAWALGDWEKALELKPTPGLMVITVKGSAMKTKAGLFKTLAKALEFPSYFGGNWDALDECLGDLRWLQAKEILLVIDGFEQVLSSGASRQELGILQQLFEDSSKNLRILEISSSKKALV